MAELDFILQAVTTTSHSKAIQTLLTLSDPTEILISVAFVRERGIDAIENVLKPVAGKTKFFVGIRNDITSVQAIKRLLKMKGVKLYAVDTGSRNTIFHPKLYFVSNDEEARVIIGSANLTFGGLHNNIEVSTIMKLDLSDGADKKFAEQVTTAFAKMLAAHPQHVFLIKNNEHADELFEAGRLADEHVIPAPSVSSYIKKGERDALPPMKLIRATQRRIKVMAGKPPFRGTTPATPTLSPGFLGAMHLVWESKGLSERDLNIPKNPGTHRTGSIGLKKGALDGIDQRHYFREEVFPDLVWVPKPKSNKLEQSNAKFELVIKNLNYGIFELELTHNRDTKSPTYKQNNMTTHISWGDAKKHVAKADLLGRILYLYRKDTDPPEFMIEID